MRKTTALGALAVLVLSASAAGQSLPELGVPPERGVLYASEALTGALIARTREVSVRVDTQREEGNEFGRYVLRVETEGGRSTSHLWPDEPYRPDEIYLLEGYACDQRLIDVLVRSAPPEHADSPAFSYVRFLVDRETLELVALVPYDPSVEVAQGIAPIQAVSAPDGHWPVFGVECQDGRVESVTERSGQQ